MDAPGAGPPQNFWARTATDCNTFLYSLYLRSSASPSGEHVDVVNTDN
jgi:hypothetical protein